MIGNTLWAAGSFTVLKSTDGGSSWRSQPLPTLEVGTLFGISAADVNNVWAVGGNSVIIHTADGGD